MKSFSRRGYRISNSALEMKLIYTFFLMFILIGFLTIGGYEFQQIGFRPTSVSEHYLGAGEEGMAFAKSFQALLETTHFHSFIMGLIYLTLAHLFVATEFPERMKRAIAVGAFIFTLSDLALPWCIRYVAAGFAPALLVAWVGEWFTYLSMIFLSLYDLWFRTNLEKRKENFH